MKPEFFQIGLMMPHVEAALIDSFVVNRCWEAADTNALFEYTRPCVRAVATDGHAGLFPEILAVLPALEISRRLHTQQRRLLSSGDVVFWHTADVQRLPGLRPLTSALPTFGPECRFIGAFQTWPRGVPKVAV